MSKYKAGDKVVVEIEKAALTDNGGGFYTVLDYMQSAISVDEKSEPLSTYTEPLEAKIQRQAAEITRLLAENEKLKAENGNVIWEIERAFNQGAEAAWELARKITVIPKDGGYGGSKLIEIFNTALINEIFNLTYPEAAAKVAEWEKVKEEIKVGDVLEDINISKVKCVITNLYPDNMAYSIFGDGTAGMHELNNFKKTGRHIDIDGFLKQIGGK